MCEEKTKVCSKCGEEKPLTEYNKDKRLKSGLRAACRVCDKARNKKYREENRERAIAASKKWREENREKARAQSKKWKNENREKVRAHKRKWAKSWRERNPDVAKARNKKYREDNPEAIKAYAKKWREENLEKKRLHNSKRRATLREATTEDFSYEDLLDFWSENEINYNECFYCKKEMPEGPEHIDHYYPLTKGGTHERANLRPSCASCNLTKGAKQPETFMEELKNGL